jgi:hypothetical protein
MVIKPLLNHLQIVIALFLPQAIPISQTGIELFIKQAASRH